MSLLLPLRSVALQMAMLCMLLVPLFAKAEDLPAYFKKCEEYSKLSTSAKLEGFLDSATQEVRADYRYLYYRTVVAYAADLEAGQVLKRATLAAVTADRLSLEQWGQLKVRLEKLELQAQKMAVSKTGVRTKALLEGPGK
ncbi:hypothetical protein POL68_15165 [Stigmatella sp. ncwal1]|uniref:Uncharacterized protein n=1 Tax=Stigmatella ashevillensis TaxID=2995309 RepID=A0ABT5D826_9BACT|nr:hypothetical protein [Stigmatella ashevillena]MDC0709811.1 hypothetical protein [Stigmatella ashevillena]